MNWEKYTMIYNPKISFNDLWILGKIFVKNNANKGRLIINNKKYNLLEFNPINSFNEDKLKISMILNQNISNRSYMFKECKSLIKLSIHDNYKDKEKVENNPNDSFIEPDYFLIDQYFANAINTISSEKNSENETYSYYSVISEKKDMKQDKSSILNLASNLTNESKNTIF